MEKGRTVATYPGSHRGVPGAAWVLECSRERKFGRSDLTSSSHTTHFHPTHTQLQVLASDRPGICPYL